MATTINPIPATGESNLENGSNNTLQPEEGPSIKGLPVERKRSTGPFDSVLDAESYIVDVKQNEYLEQLWRTMKLTGQGGFLHTLGLDDAAFNNNSAGGVSNSTSNQANANLLKAPLNFSTQGPGSSVNGNNSTRGSPRGGPHSLSGGPSGRSSNPLKYSVFIYKKSLFSSKK